MLAFPTQGKETRKLLQKGKHELNKGGVGLTG